MDPVVERPVARYNLDVRLAFLLLALPLPSAFAAEGEQGLSVSAGYANLSIPQTADDGSDTDLGVHGGMAQIDWERGLNDTLWFRAAASGGFYDGPVNFAYSAAVVADLVYRFDYIRYVPYLFGGAGGVLGFGEGVDTKILPVVELGIGLDVLESRDFSWGLEIKADASYSFARFVTVGAKASWRWGYF